jgi:hypothetical protein
MMCGNENQKMEVWKKVYWLIGNLRKVWVQLSREQVEVDIWLTDKVVGYPIVY